VRKRASAKNATKETKKVRVPPAGPVVPVDRPTSSVALADVENAAVPPLEPDCPAEWSAGVARLGAMPRPDCVGRDRWRQAIIDAGRFLDRWGAAPAALGWTTLDLFGAHPTHPIERLDCAGLVISLHGDEVAAITAETALTRRRRGALLTYYRRPLATAVPVWELAIGSRRAAE
jgi:hypothetical protein